MGRGGLRKLEMGGQTRLFGGVTSRGPLEIECQEAQRSPSSKRRRRDDSRDLSPSQRKPQAPRLPLKEKPVVRTGTWNPGPLALRFACFPGLETPVLPPFSNGFSRFPIIFGWPSGPFTPHPGCLRKISADDAAALTFGAGGRTVERIQRVSEAEVELVEKELTLVVQGTNLQRRRARRGRKWSILIDFSGG